MTLSSLRRMYQVLVMGLGHAETTAMVAWGLGVVCELILVCPPSLPCLPPASSLPRSGMMNLAPTSTGSATAIALIFPELKVRGMKGGRRRGGGGGGALPCV